MPIKWMIVTSSPLWPHLYQNGTWTVACKVQTSVAFPPFFPGTSITVSGTVGVKHLDIGDIDITTALEIQLEGPFVALKGEEADVVIWAVPVDDGYEVSPQVNVGGAFEFERIHGGTSISEDLPLQPAPCDFSGCWASVEPGLYYIVVNVADDPGAIDNDSYLSKYLTVDSVEVVDFVVPAPRTGRPTIEVTTSDAGQNEIAQDCYVWFIPGLEDLVRVTGPVPAATNTTEALLMPDWPFGYAGNWTLGVSYMDDHATMYHDGQPKWAQPTSANVFIPADAVFYDACDPVYGNEFTSQALYQEGLLVYLPPPPGSDGATFYSPRWPDGVRGGPVPCPEKATVLEALQDDHVISWVGHGWHENLGLCTDHVTRADIEALPSGSLSQARLVWLSSCGGYPEPWVSPSIGQALADRGAQGVFGYKWECFASAPALHFEETAWESLRDGASLAAAISEAKMELLIDGVDLAKLGIEDNPATSDEEGVNWHNGAATIAPAFVMP